MRRFICSFAVVLACAFFAQSTRAAQHLWNLNEIYTNSSGTLQFIELATTSGNQQFTGGFQVNVTDVSNTTTHSFTVPSNLPSDSANHKFLLGTSGIAGAGGPTPDFIIPTGFLFSSGGTINFFGANSGAYTALPTDGILSRTWAGGNATNSPQNFAGQIGLVPEPSTMTLFVCGIVGASRILRRRRVA
jgi:hypothetical protein